MAGTVIAPQVISGKTVAIAPVFQAAAAQMEVPNEAPTTIHFRATGAVTITFVNQTKSPTGGSNPDEVVGPLAAGNERIVRVDPAAFNMGNGNVQMNIDTPANLTVNVHQVA